MPTDNNAPIQLSTDRPGFVPPTVDGAIYLIDNFGNSGEIGIVDKIEVSTFPDSIREKLTALLLAAATANENYPGVSIIPMHDAAEAFKRFREVTQRASDAMADLAASLVPAITIETSDPAALIAALNAPKLIPKMGHIPNDRHRIASTRGAFK